MASDTRSTTVAIVETHQLHADALALLLRQDTRVRVLSVCTFDAEIPSTPVDCLLVAVDHPRGLELATRRTDDSVRVVGLHSGLGPELAAQLFDAKVAAAVPRDVGVHEVVDALIGELSSSSLMEQVATPPPELSARELAVLRLIAEGRTAAEIARRLRLSTGETNAAKRRLLRRLGVRTQAEAVARARRIGILD